MKKTGKSKILVIGLDGGTWTIFRPLMEMGIMPNLAKLVREGTTGVLKSVVPPVTAPAWASFTTGKYPDKHSVFDFRQFDTRNCRENLVNATSIKSATLWQILSQAGKKQIVVNVPLTFPPQAIDGIMISGMMSPGIEGQLEPRFCYPADLGVELARRFPDYRTFVSQDIYFRDGLDAFLSKLTAGLQNRLNLCLYLMQQHPYDFFMVHFQNPDSMQHALWPDLVKAADPNSRKSARTAGILAYFRQLDAAIGRLQQPLGPNDNLIIISDHGFGPLDRFFNLNAWLARQGWLKYRQRLPAVRFWVYLAKKIPCFLFRLQLNRLKMVNNALYRLKMLLGHYEQDLKINWQQTIAYATFGPQIFGLVYLISRNTVPDREDRKNLLDILYRELSDVRDPDSGDFIVEKVYLTEKPGESNLAAKMPDLIVQLRPGYICFSKHERPELFENANRDRGTHQIDGMVLFHGSGIRKNRTLKKARIVDVMPTILAMFNLPIPADVDGFILAEIFKEPLQKIEPALELVPCRTKTDWEYDFSKTESEQISQRLRELGYLGDEF